MATTISKPKNLSLGALLAILLILISIPVITYYLHFSENGISNKNDDWGNFAGFIGDILSPILNIINIMVVYYLALKVNLIEENRDTNNKNLENQRRGNDFKYSAFKEISGLIFEVIKEITAMPDNQQIPISPILLLQLQYLLDGHNKLFKSLDSTNYNPTMTKLKTYESLDLADKRIVLTELNALMQDVIKELGFE